MQAILIKGGRVIDPANGLDATADVLLADGKVKAVGALRESDVKPWMGKAAGVEVLNAKGLWVLPGLVDLRAHLGEPGNESAETIAGGALAAIHGGITTLACMPDTDPPIDTEAQVQFVLARSRLADMAEVLPVAALTKRREGRELAELGQLVAAGAVAFSDEMRATDSPSTLLKGMAYASMFDRPVIEFAQDPNLAGGAMNAGYEATLAGLPGIPALAEELAVARACMFARETGCHYHAAKLTTRNAIRAVKRARKLRVKVSAATCPHYFALTDAEVRRRYDTAYKVFPPLRTKDDVAWIRRGLREGIIDCISSDHTPVPPELKELEFGRAPFGIVGLQTLLPVTLTELVHGGELPLAQAVAAMTVNPARLLRVAGRKGSLTVGHDADVALVDPQETWTLEEAGLVSRCRNTPFIGMKFKGRVKFTIARGRLFDVSVPQAAGA
ncbi:dihydroorotase [bacterium]|nr:MAG: dihydroorotase [bacterium]